MAINRVSTKSTIINITKPPFIDNNSNYNKYKTMVDNSKIYEPSSTPEYKEEYYQNKLVIGSIKEDFNSELDLQSYEKRMEDILNNSHSTREKVNNLAIFISSEFPKLPYVLDYTSGHDGTDLHGLSWTKEIVQRDDGSYDNRSLDCSGLVSWCFQNAGLEVPGYGVTTDYRSYVGEDNIQPIVGNDLSIAQPGDLAHNPENGGHIGVIVDVNREKKEITVVHTSSSGKGVNITTISTNTGIITKDDTGSAGIDRTGQENYFTEIFHVPYEEKN